MLFAGYDPRFVVLSSLSPSHFPLEFVHHCWSSGWSDIGRGADLTGGTNCLLQEEDIQEERRENE